MDDQSRIAAEYMKCFDGRDPIKEALKRTSDMSHKDLAVLTMVAANKLGTAIKGSDYDNTLDSMVHVGMALEIIFDAYDRMRLAPQTLLRDKNR